jgi:phospholipase/lecithinase/hemolysin
MAVVAANNYKEEVIVSGLRNLVLALAGGVVMGAASAPAGAAAYSGIVAFGDSLSDNGNFAASVGGLFPGPLFGYYPGRFSNGPVAVEYLAQSLGLDLTDYAFGGARTGAPVGGGSDNYVDDSGQAASLGIPSGAFNGTGVTAQVSTYLTAQGGAADPGALFVVWAGPNDYFLPASLIDPLTASNAVSNLQLSITTLYNAGARDFLVPNMADLGITPSFLEEGALTAGIATSRSIEHNNGLAAMLAALDADLAGARFRSVDVFSLLNHAVADPGLYGLSNVDTACQSIAACRVDPTGYLFWDEVHVTTAAHQLVASAFVAALVPEAQTWAMLLAGLGVVGVARRLRA